MIWSIDKPIKNKYIFFIFIYLQQGDACQTEEVDEENKSLIWTLVKQVNKCYILWRVNKYTTKGRDQFYWATTPLKSYKDRNICDITYKCNVLYSLDLSLKSFFHRKSQILRKYQNSEVVIDPCLIHLSACSVNVLPAEFNFIYKLYRTMV